MKLDRFITFCALLLFVIAILSIAFNLCGHVLIDEKDYIAFVKWNDFTINAGMFVFTASYLCLKLFRDPRSDAGDKDAANPDIHLN